MKTYVDFGPTATGIVFADLTCHAMILSGATAADFTDATLTECDATNLPGLYILDAPNILATARGKVWVTATPAIWAKYEVDRTTKFIDDLTHIWPDLKADLMFKDLVAIVGALPAGFVVSYSEAIPPGVTFYLDGITPGDQNDIYGLRGDDAIRIGTLSSVGWVIDAGFTDPMPRLALSITLACSGATLPAGTLTVSFADSPTLITGFPTGLRSGGYSLPIVFPCSVLDGTTFNFFVRRDGTIVAPVVDTSAVTDTNAIMANMAIFLSPNANTTPASVAEAVVLPDTSFTAE